MKPLFPFTLNKNSIQAPGLIFWGPGGLGNGNLFDASPSHDNGLIGGSVPSAVWCAGVEGPGKTAMKFTKGTTFVDLVSSASLPVSTGISVSCWINTTDTTYNYLMVKWGVANGSDSWHLRLDTTTGFAYWNVSTSGNYQAGHDLNGTTNLADGKWHLLIATYDGVNEKIYVDGVLQATLAVTGAIFTTSNLVWFGGLSDGSTSTNWFGGRMEDPRIYNYAINQAVVTDMWNPATRWNLRYKPKQIKYASRLKVTEAAPTYPPIFTGQLGTDRSMAGFIFLGSAGSNTTNASASNTLTISQEVLLGAVENVTQSLTISQSVSFTKSLGESVSNSLTISQSVSLTSSRAFSASNTLELSQQIIRGPIAKLGTTDSKPLNFKLGFQTTSQNLTESISQSLTLSQTAAHSTIYNRSISQSLTITQSDVDVNFTQFASNSLSISQSATYTRPNQSVSQSLSITESATHTGEFSKSLSTSLNIIQSADFFKFKPIDVSQSLTISQVADVVATTGVNQSLTITQAVVYQYDPHNEYWTSPLVLAQTVSAPITRPRSASESLTIHQTVTSVKQLDRSVTQHFTIAQTATAQKRTALEQSLTLSQSVVVAVQRGRIVTQSLVLTQSVHAQITFNRSLTNTLVFSNEHQIPDGTGGFIILPNLIYTKGFVGSDVCCPGVGKATTIVGAFSTIVLPNPELGDAEAPVSAIKIIRTITGDVYTYARKNRSRKLKYKFIITRKKAFELRVFLLQNLTKRVNLTNWKGEMWNVNFLTDPIDLIADKHCEPPCGEWYTVELDFEGIRIN
jgi:hypothetical protein